MMYTLKDTVIAFCNPDLWTAKAPEAGGKAKFKSSFLIPKSRTKVIAELDAIFMKVATAKWGEKAAIHLKNAKMTDKGGYRDGDLKTYDGYAGNFYVSASNEIRPNVKDVTGTSIVTAADGIIYAGCRVFAYLEFWAQSNQHGKCIRATLRGVQYFGEGRRFSGGDAASDEEMTNLAVGEETGETEDLTA